MSFLQVKSLMTMKEKLTLIRAAGAYLTSETLKRYNSAMAYVVRLKIRVFLEKHLVSISSSVLLSEKRRFQQFISQNVRKTICFFAVFVYFGWL
jgi:hypothetical protein